MFVSRFNIINNSVYGLISGGWNDGFYRFFLLVLLFCFLSLRVPYIFGLFGFGWYLFFYVFPLFIGLFFSRIFSSVDSFFSSFIPLGTPLWIAPFVCLAETLSYIVRPVVLLIRPFVNLSMGSLGGYVLGGMCFNSNYLLIFLVLLFFYEVFVAVVHWFIVCNILSFSEDH
uniref:ATP synthase F0 subunit 6 n=1 Tax=Plagiorchis multiglandularis TaxID=3026102 RepID=UPI0023D852FF|nr:ATP synthase F0 subunit 6 [Plagiorchis multiglandularis]WCQ78408.1 ATP synthase F0 subunit 6 [Plagiorchis multiglandularis]